MKPDDLCKSTLETQYKYSIDARDKLNDNYHKWMTYYYIANAGILVAISSIFKASQANISILFLSLIGVFISVIWNTSCKGYYYWSLSWIDIIKRYEKLMSKNNPFQVYSIFSKEVADREISYFSPTGPANISTPKLTIFFSLFSIFCWTIYSIYQFWLQISNALLTTLFSVSIIFLLWVIYKFAIPTYFKSLDLKSHSNLLVECRGNNDLSLVCGAQP